ncbi:hypothetical protein KKG45_07830 [bacterium]|nr:hypothetical protein [bacterium]MBU1073141.1 hypothetical protein [bacterium]MBU1674358.1 hypothetical protein [bacterium]
MAAFSSAWFIALAVLLAAAALFLLLRRRVGHGVAEDAYTHGLELWLAGDTAGAIEALREAIDQEPQAVDPYLQLGNLLRLTGDPRRAAALHRGLNARPGLPPHKRISVTLALTEDLLSLELWDEAGDLLDSLLRHNLSAPRFWRARFRQFLGQGQEDGAARALKEGAKRAPAEAAAEFADQYELFQLDRAVRAAQAGHHGEARRLARTVDKTGSRGHLALYVRAYSHLGEQNHERAAELATEGLLLAPAAADLLLPVLRKALLAAGRFERSIPILESACQDDDAPPSLWLALALLQEKIGDREQAVSMLESKRGDPRLTPAVAAGYLRILVNDLPDSDFTRVWSTLFIPEGPRSWTCRVCAAQSRGVRWYCRDCGSFASFAPPASYGEPA